MEYTYKYPRPAVTADCVVMTKGSGATGLADKERCRPIQRVLGISGRFHEHG